MCSRIQIGAVPSKKLSHMPFPSKLSEEQWAEARQLRAGGLSYAAIGAALKITATTVSKRARREGWDAPPAARQATRPGVRIVDEFKQARRNLSRRILKILDLDLKIMEIRMLKRVSDAGKTEAPEGLSNDELKRLGTLKQTIQEHTEFSPDTEPNAGGAGRAESAGEAAASEADVFRREIAERLEKLLPPS